MSSNITPWSVGASLVAILAVAKWVKAYKISRQLAHIPAVGHSGIFTSYLTAFRFALDAPKVTKEGYDQYPGQAFRIATITEWVVVVSGPELVGDLARAPEDALSFMKSVNDFLSIPHTLGEQVAFDPYHIEIIRTLLNKNISVRFPDVRDEVVQAFNRYIPPSKEWTPYVFMKTIMPVVSRASNRLFVGAPLCQNEDYVTLNVEFTMDVAIGGAILSLFPEFMRPYMKHLVARKLGSSLERGMKHLGPVFEEALSNEEKYGKDWAERPNNMVHWLLTQATGNRRTIENLTRTILTINFAAIHTTSGALTNAIYDLASRPELIEPLRQEVEMVTEQEGWSKDAMGQLSKMDSFLRESGRLSGIGAVQMRRTAMKDFAFSDGTVIPAGITVATPGVAMATDSTFYSQEDSFDAFKWAGEREKDGPGSTKDLFTSTSKEFQMFGHGRHACPGRFFAVNEVKAILAHIIMTYDIKMAEGVRPPNIWIMDRVQPNPNSVVLFRARSRS